MIKELVLPIETNLSDNIFIMFGNFSNFKYLFEKEFAKDLLYGKRRNIKESIEILHSFETRELNIIDNNEIFRIVINQEI